MRAVAVNVGANTNAPRFRGPVRPDGGFTFLPIPESEPTREAVPTYGDLASALDFDRDALAEVLETPVHLDPTFSSYPRCVDYTYGDPHPVKAGPLGDLAAGDYVFFYATLSVSEPADWLPPTWGAFVVGQFRLARDPVTPAGEETALSPAERERFGRNAHLRRSEFDARVLLAGDPTGSVLYDRALPLSRPSGGTDANEIVTDLSGDSGAGPWWRRPLRFAGADARRLLDRIDAWRSRENVSR